MSKHMIQVENNGQVEETVEFNEGEEGYYDTLDTLRRSGFSGDIIRLYRIEGNAKALIDSIKVD